MAIPAGVGRISLRGHLRGGEIWETGWWGVGSNFETNTGCNAVAASVVATLGDTDVVNNLLQIWDAATGLDGVVVYGYPNGGPRATTMGEAPINGYNGTGSGDLPLQACLVATTLTGQPGRSYRGRMYWPATGCVLTTSQASATTCQQIALATATLVHQDSSSNAGPIVLSQKHGTHLPLVAVRVDSKIDTQRRRARSESALHLATNDVPS